MKEWRDGRRERRTANIPSLLLPVIQSKSTALSPCGLSTPIPRHLTCSLPR